MSKGFTLIELLVVVAILALLAAILFPVFSRARENARRTNCISNMKQIGLGVLQYTQDYDEYYPAANFYVGADHLAGYLPNTWRHAVYPYVKSKQIYACPSSGTKAENLWQPNFNDGAGTIEKYPVSYTGNRWAMGDLSTCDGASPLGVRKLSTLHSPATTVFVIDGRISRPSVCGAWFFSTSYNIGNSTVRILHTPLPASYANSDNGLFESHLGTVNIMFADGHVKAQKLASTFTPKNLWQSDIAGVTAANFTAYANTLPEYR
jgi:prepilin-type N-terminal cleavage/methylation domain-containing protein/prepilin-type processing-associated H-X9-DG protein